MSRYIQYSEMLIYPISLPLDTHSHTYLSVYISVPLWQIRMFGLLFMANPDFRIYPDFCTGPHRPYILFSNY